MSVCALPPKYNQEKAPLHLELKEEYRQNPKENCHFITFMTITNHPLLRCDLPHRRARSDHSYHPGSR